MLQDRICKLLIWEEEDAVVSLGILIDKLLSERSRSESGGWLDEPENSSGAIGARLSADATRVRSLVGDSFALLVQNVASAVAGLVIAFEASWQLAQIIFAILPLIAINGHAQMQGFVGARLVEDGKTTFARVFRVFFALTMAAIAVSQSSSLAPDATKAQSFCSFHICNARKEVEYRYKY